MRVPGPYFDLSDIASLPAVVRTDVANYIEGSGVRVHAVQWLDDVAGDGCGRAKRMVACARHPSPREVRQYGSITAFRGGFVMPCGCMADAEQLASDG